MPQLSVLPQPSLMTPQLSFWARQVVFMQEPTPQTLGVPPPPQFRPVPQVPQDSVFPQPSGSVPQFRPPQVTGTHGTPQTFGVPPAPQERPPVHVPQVSVLPHPSETDPHLAFRLEQVDGVQVPLFDPGTGGVQAARRSANRAAAGKRGINVSGRNGGGIAESSES